MAIKRKTINNPHSSQLQLILNEQEIAEKIHNHSIGDISGLQTILSQLTQNTNINLGGGYFSY